MNYAGVMGFLKESHEGVYSNEEYYKKIVDWLSWYGGNVIDFHTMQNYNGITMEEWTMYHLNMAKKVSEDWASAILNEGVDFSITTGNKKSSVFVQGTRGTTGVLGSNNFFKLLPNVVEQMFALGTVCLALELDNIGVTAENNVVGTELTRIKIRNYNALSIIPLAYDNGEVTEVVLISEASRKGKLYTILTEHVIDNGVYVIKNVVLDDKFNISNEDFGLLPEFNTGSTKPLFYIMKTNMVNNVDLNSPMGISIYANAIDILKTTDQAFNELSQEVDTGRRIIRQDINTLQRDLEGNPMPPKDKKSRYMYCSGDAMLDETSTKLDDFSPQLRIDQLKDNLNLQLSMLSSSCGFGSRYYSFVSDGIKTATEYVGERNEFVRNARKYSRYIETVLNQMITGVLYLGKNFCGYAIDDGAKVVTTVSDGIVEDDGTMQKLDMEKVSAGLMAKYEYRMKWLNEPEEVAKEKVEYIRQESQEKVNGVKGEVVVE